MNKLTKGAIATAAGIALLMGGAGTFALWNDSVGVNGGTVQTGTLDIDTTGTGTWKDVSSTVVGGTTFNPATQKLVPGDVVTYTKSVSITSVGKNLKAKLSYDPTSIVIDPALAGKVTVALTTANVTGGTAVADAAPNTFIVTPSAAAAMTVDVVITVTFDSTTANQVGQNLANGVNLTGASFTLVQVRP